MKLVDYSYARPQPFATRIVTSGYVGAMRYLGNDTPRCLTRAECDQLHEEGIGIGLIWETKASRALDGYQAGCWDAESAAAHAALVGAPSWVPIYFAVDVDVNPAQVHGQVREYFRGAMGCAHPTRAYGEADVLDMLAQDFGARMGWQPGAQAWSGWRISSHAAMLQSAYYVLDNSCDENKVLIATDQVDWIWGGNDVPLSQEDLNRVKDLVNNGINEALTRLYVGSHALAVEGRPEVWELVDVDGRPHLRYIPRPAQQRLFQHIDRLSGPRDQQPRVLTDPGDIAEFDALPKLD